MAQGPSSTQIHLLADVPPAWLCGIRNSNACSCGAIEHHVCHTASATPTAWSRGPLEGDGIRGGCYKPPHLLQPFSEALCWEVTDDDTHARPFKVAGRNTTAHSSPVRYAVAHGYTETTAAAAHITFQEPRKRRSLHL